MESDEAVELLSEIIEQYRRELQLALRRQAGAMRRLSAADKDIQTLSGAIMALESASRQLMDSPSLPATKVSEELRAVTLAGEV